MENQPVNTDLKQKKGVHLNRLNIFMIFIGLVIALFMVFSMYETNRSSA